MILGFGSTEAEFETREIQAFVDRVKERFVALDLPYFTDEFVKEIEAWTETRGEEYRGTAEGHREAETFPDRYSSFYPYIASSASLIAAVFKFSHYNRRHALSPDGWALMSTVQCGHVLSADIR